MWVLSRSQYILRGTLCNYKNAIFHNDIELLNFYVGSNRASTLSNFDGAKGGKNKSTTLTEILMFTFRQVIEALDRK